MLGASYMTRSLLDEGLESMSVKVLLAALRLSIKIGFASLCTRRKAL